MNNKEYLKQLFAAVHEWAEKRCEVPVPRLSLSVGCPEIERRFRRGDARSFFHVGHKMGRVCASPRAAKLPVHFLVGLMLHEIGHPLAIKVYGRSDQWDADRSIKEFLGVRIHYGGPLILEFVPWGLAKKIIEGRNLDRAYRPHFL